MYKRQLEDLLSHREANGEFPEFLVKVRCGNEEEILFFHDMEALTAISDENRDLFIFGMPSEEELLENPLPEREGPSPLLVYCRGNVSCHYSNI